MRRPSNPPAVSIESEVGFGQLAVCPTATQGAVAVTVPVSVIERETAVWVTLTV